MLKHYKPAGGFSPASFAYFLLVAAILLPLSAVYAIITIYSPLIYVNVIAAGGFAALVGILVSFLVIKIGKVRSRSMAFFFGFIAALIAVYFQWAAWLGFMTGDNLYYGGFDLSNAFEDLEYGLYLLTNPLEMLQGINVFYFEGAWTFEGTLVKGPFLLVIWIIEALIILGFSIYFPLKAAKKPFCENGNEWFKEKQIHFTYITNKTEFIADLQAGGAKLNEALSTFNLATIAGKNHSVLHVFYSQQGEYYLTIENKRPKGKNNQFDSQVLEEYMELDPTVASALMTR